jgi:eukaryotic-like serine/threonine-protein kinase
VTLPVQDAWAAALAAFDELAELDPATRDARLAAIAAASPEMRAAVERLLAADSSAHAKLTRFDHLLEAEPHEPDPLHMSGRTISHFRVIQPLARGGMGVVYRAEDLRLGRVIALKFPLAGVRVDSAAKQRFRHEARVAAGLDHPNLCPVYEVDETADGDFFYTMPLYDGESLKTRLERTGALPLDQAVGIAGQLAGGLAAAHQAGIVHRDLKPGNVMLLPDGTAKILDFGLAKSSDVSLTASSVMLGTISYMAPEQISGNEADRRADLWALGVLLYEMTTARRPFTGGNDVGVAHAILHDEPRRPSTLRGDIPREFDALVRRLLQKDPSDRYQSATEVASALRGDRSATSGGAPRRLSRAFGQRVSARVAVLAGLAVLVAAALAIWANGRTTASIAPVAPVALAVLPFDWSGDSTGTQYLATAMGDAIATDLNRLSGVVVPGYQTTFRYRGTTKSLHQIAAEQQVRFLFRGTVQRTGDRVRVDARLVDPANGDARWEHRYERPLNELPKLERELVEQTVAALGVRTTSHERDVLDASTGIGGRAYDVYLRGRAAELAGQPRPWFGFTMPPENTRSALSLYSQARDLEPRFAVARARLSMMHAQAAASYDRSEGHREQARIEAQEALRLRPGLAEAHEAFASYHSLTGDQRRAVEELGLAIDGFSHSAGLRSARAFVLVHSGRREEAVLDYREAMSLEPGNVDRVLAAASNLSRLRRRAESIPLMDRAIALAPDNFTLRAIKGLQYLRWKGTADTLAAAMRTIPADWDPDGMATYTRFTAFWVQRRYAEGLRMLDQSHAVLSRDEAIYQPVSLMRAQLAEASGDRRLARVSYAAARSVIQDSIDAHPTAAMPHLALGLAYAGLGRNVEARREANRAMELAPVASDAELAAGVMGGAVEVLAKAGDVDAAFDRLELLFTMPAGREVTTPFLRAWPGFDPLRKDSRFEELLARYPSTE